MSPQDLETCSDVRLDFYSKVVSSETWSGEIDEHGEARVLAYKKALQLTDEQTTTYDPTIANARAAHASTIANARAAQASQAAREQMLQQVRQGALPEVLPSPIVVKQGEKVHFVCNAQLIEERVLRRETVGGSQGVSIHLMKGLTYRVGAYRGTSVPVRGPVIVSEGMLCVTSDRLAFAGTKKSFSIEFGSLLTAQVAPQGLMIAPRTGTTRMLAFVGAVDTGLLTAILTRLIGTRVVGT
jgi:hypothetical protein